ncbi:PREDICTED: zinc finger protein 271-like [Rhagoletis zephyria]|uniref:zinc finger protein 271-like n=1 Tax=Rhagoletis zephyria TaxID=28612 RepID=UPI000811526E|nr:PREDICTED: zinc finger protein 271-like [Rhagoletis zephyria]
MMEIKLEVDTLLMCRICLQSSEEGEEMASIFDQDANSVCLYEKIENCGGIKILTEPELPTRICKKCNAFLTIAHKFRIICKNSDDYLRKFVCKSSELYGEEDNNSENVMEYNSNAQLTQQTEHIANETQNATDYEGVAIYSEVWIQDEENEEDLIVEDLGEISQHSQSVQQQKPNPSQSKKTLGITSDGAAVIRVRNERQLSKEKHIHICDICGNIYPRKYALDAHMRRHRDERPYECEICGQSFHLNFQLTRHIRKHTGVRPYACQYCKRTFSDRSTMLKHERIHRNERPYVCGTCGKSFTYSSVLKVHTLTHTGEKPFTYVQNIYKVAFNNLKSGRTYYVTSKCLACFATPYKNFYVDQYKNR